jgi:hypothetical protein
MITLFPRSANASVNANPMPLPPPVMSTVFPDVFMNSFSISARLVHIWRPDENPVSGCPDCQRPL